MPDPRAVLREGLPTVTLADFELMKKTAAVDDGDIALLRASQSILASRADAILDVWYGFVGSHPHLLHHFSARDTGSPIPEYLAAVRERFAWWILIRRRPSTTKRGSSIKWRSLGATTASART